MQAKGYIDSASLHMVILALRHGKPAQWNDWTWETVQYVTCALWGLRDFSVAPDPSGEPAAHGPFSQLLHGLRPVFSGVQRSDRDALSKTRRWMRQDLNSRLKLCRETQSDPRFAQWLEWYMDYFWEHHSIMHGSLFTKEFIPELTAMCGCSHADLAKLNILTGDHSMVNRWVRKRPNSEDFRLALDAFCISTLMRGRYHDYAARNAGQSIMHHPMRIPFLPKARGEVQFQISNTQQYLTNILVGSALMQTGISARLHSWADNLLKIKAALSDQRLDLGEKDRDEVAVECAIDAAKRSGIEVHPRMLDRLMGIFMSLGTGSLTGFLLDPWLAAPAAAGTAVVSRLARAPERIVSAVYRRTSHLEKLARAPAGRVSRVLQRSMIGGERSGK